MARNKDTDRSGEGLKIGRAVK